MFRPAKWTVAPGEQWTFDSVTLIGFLIDWDLCRAKSKALASYTHPKGALKVRISAQSCLDSSSNRSPRFALWSTEKVFPSRWKSSWVNTASQVLLYSRPASVDCLQLHQVRSQCVVVLSFVFDPSRQLYPSACTWPLAMLAHRVALQPGSLVRNRPNILLAAQGSTRPARVERCRRQHPSQTLMLAWLRF